MVATAVQRWLLRAALEVLQTCLAMARVTYRLVVPPRSPVLAGRSWVKLSFDVLYSALHVAGFTKVPAGSPLTVQRHERPK
jgi:hypothetical protein